MKKLLFASALFIFAAGVQAQVLLSGGLTYSQNFDTLANTGTSGTWTDNSTLTGWYASRAYTAGTTSAYGPFAYTSYRVDAGATTSGSIYSYGSASSTDRALGSLSSGTPKTNSFGVLFQNDTGTALNNVLISYTGEQWRNGGNTAQNANTLAFSYKVFTSPFAAPLDVVAAGVNGWTGLSALDFVSPVTAASGGALDGNALGNRTTLTGILIPGLTLNPGEQLFLRWVDIDDSGNDHGLAVDDLTAAFSPAVIPEPSVLALGGLGILTVLLRRRK
jgi:hypothetical protein